VAISIVANMLSSEAESDVSIAILEDLSKELMNDQPSIDEALKNTISLLVAKSMTTSEDKIANGECLITADVALACARFISKSINGSDLSSLECWIKENPQGDDQLAVDRIEEITRMKVCKFLYDKVKSSATKDPNAKITKLFGRKFIVYTKTWDAITAKVLEDCEGMINLQEIEYFLSTFKQSIDLESITSDPEILNSSTLVDTQLIWSNLTKSLEVRSECRNKEINAAK